MTISETLGQRLKIARHKAKRHQSEVAKASGMVFQTLSKWECGKAEKVSLQALASIADTLGVSVDWLLGRESK